MKQVNIRILARKIFILPLLLFFITSSYAFAGDAEKGKARAIVCSACHGADGISFIPTYPNLAGQKEQYLISALKAYRSGLRKNMQMTPQAQKLSDEEIANLAAYYSQLSPTQPKE